MKSFATSILINAPAERIWDILVDVANWPSWNTTVDKVDGEAALGRKVSVYARISPGRAFPLTVTEFAPPHRMVWRGGAPFGTFVGTRTYELIPMDDERVRFEITESFTGFMSRFMLSSIPDLQPSFAEFAECLKRAAEGA
jgi:hypothetical protein